MTKYVALLRGIGPGNPNMRNDKLRSVFEKLGYKNVQSVISSGNIVFESDQADIAAMEKIIQESFPRLLGIAPTTIIRSQAQLQRLVTNNPFQGLTHGPSSYLMVTFFKYPTKVDYRLPYQPDSKPYTLLSATNHELFTTTDNTLLSTTDLMSWLEKQFTKEISSRTWLTVNRILKKMQN